MLAGLPPESQTALLTLVESTVASRMPAQTLVSWMAPVQVATLSDPTVHLEAKASTVAPRAMKADAGVAMDCATVDVMDKISSGTAAGTGLAVGAGIGAGAGAAVTRVPAVARARMMEEMHCILAVWLLVGRVTRWYNVCCGWMVATWGLPQGFLMGCVS